MTSEEFWGILCIFGTAELNIKANELLHEADRIERRNPPWARNLRRKALRLREKAFKLAGDKTPIYAPCCYQDGLYE